jgi:hypothetical protein
VGFDGVMGRNVEDDSKAALRCPVLRTGGSEGTSYERVQAIMEMLCSYCMRVLVQSRH